MTIAAASRTQPCNEVSKGLAPLEGSIPPDLAKLSVTRSELKAWLRGQADQHQADDVVLVFNELLANAINAAAPQELVQYRVERNELGSSSHIRLTVTNFGAENWWIDTAMPAPDAEGGRGLPIAEMYSDKLEIFILLDRVEATATFRSDNIPYLDIISKPAGFD